MPFLPLPNGSYVEVPSGLSDEQAFKLAKEQFPEGFEDYAEHKNKTGLLPAVKSGFKEGAGSALESIGNLFGSEDVAKYGKQTREEAAGQYEPTTSADMDVARRQGITSLLGTGLSKYITEPVGQAVGSVAGRYGAPIAAGAAATALAPEGAVLGAGAGALGFAAANFPIHFGEDITAQKEAGQQPDYGRALVPAMVQTAVDSLGGSIVGGAMRGFALKTATQEAKLLAPKVLSGELAAKDAAAQISGKLTSVLKGTVEAAGAGTLMSTVGTAGQRFAAGQDVFSPEALDQYTEGAKQMGLVAPFFGLLHAGQPAKAKALIDNAGKKFEQEKVTKEAAEQQHADILQQTGDLVAPVTGEGPGQLLRDPMQVEAEKDFLRQEEQQKTREIADQHRVLKKEIDDLEDKVSKAAEEGDVDTITQLNPRLKQMRTAFADIDKQYKKAVPLEQSPDVQLAQTRGQLKQKLAQLQKVGGVSYDAEKVDKLVPQIKELQDKLDAFGKQGTQFELFDPAREAAEKKEAVALQKERLGQEQADLIAQQQKPQIDTLDKYQQGLQELEEAHAAGADERTINSMLDKLREAQLEKGLSSAEPLEQAGARIERIKRALEEEKNNYNKAPTDEEKAVSLANIGALEKRLANAQVGVAKSRPEVEQSNAKSDQAEAHDTLLDAVDDIKSGRYLGGGVDLTTAASMRSGLEQKARGAAGAYIESAVRDVEATRASSGQVPLTTNEALKLSLDLKDTLDKVIANKNSGVLKVPEGKNVSYLENQIESIKAKYLKGEKKKLTAEKPFFTSKERDAAQMLRTERAKKTPDLQKIRLLEQEVEAGRKEDERLTLEKEKAERKEPTGVNVEQRELFGEKELEPIAVVRASNKNFMRFVDSQAAKFKLAQEKAEKVIEDIKEKADKSFEKQRELEKRSPKLDKEFVKQVQEQREFVLKLANAENLAKEMRDIAAKLWQDKTNPERLAKVDALYKEAKALKNENIKTQKAILESMERKLAKMEQPSKYAKEQKAYADKARAIVAQMEGDVEKASEKAAREKRLAEQEMEERLKELPSKKLENVVAARAKFGNVEDVVAKRITERSVPKTAEEKRAELKAKARETAEEQAALKRAQKERREQGLTQDEEIKAVMQRQAMRAGEVLGNAPARKQRRKVNPSEKATRKANEDVKEALKFEKEYEPEYSPRFNIDDLGNVFRIDEETGKERVELADARKTVEAFNAKLSGDIKKVVYADRFEDLTPEDKAKFEGAEEDARKMKGAVTPDGTMFVIGEHHPDLVDVERTLAHEAFGHYGFDRLVGKKGLFDLANKIEAEGGIVKMATEMGVRDDVLDAIRQAKRMGYSEEVQKVQALREMVAHVEQGRLDGGMLKRAGRFVKEIVGAIRNWMRENGLSRFAKETSDADIMYMLRQARDAMTGKGTLKGEGFEQTAYRKAKFSDESDPLAQLAGHLVAKPKGIKDSLKGNLVAFNTQFIDRLAPLKEIWRRMGETGPASQMMYNLLAHGQRNNISSETVVNGARTFFKDPTTGEVTIRASGGPGMKQVLQELLQSTKGNPQALNEMFTAYAAAKRAEVVGYKKLVADGEVSANITPQMLEAAKKSGDADPAFVKAFETYQKYNNGLIDSLADSGYIAKEKATELKNKNYIPYYRSRGGVIDLVIGSETPIRIGTLKDQPYLHELVGGDQKIQDFFKSSVQNTNMITEMALRNNATASVARTLQDLGVAEIRKGDGEARPDTIRFKANGKDYHAIIDTSKNAEFSDIDPNLLVKGMEGIPTQLPGIVRLMGMPANWLRKGVTRNPFYAYKQLVRDPMSAWLTTGANFTPILSSLKEVNNAVRGAGETNKHLQESGILGGEVYTGRAEDLNQIVTRLQSGKASVAGAMAFMDKMASEADASTRSVLYDSFRKQGLTDMEAQIATMESMNFNTRGASPSMHWVNTMVPFFNSAIQGYNVMYKAFTGKMPYAKKLDLQNKLIKRGSMIAGMSILYAIANQDNDAYKNATPDQKYLNWFVPGFGKDGKEAFRLPIPFEAGYIFKALPEALVNMAYKDDAAKEGLDAISTVLQQTNPLGIPTAIKAPIELAMNRSLYTGKDIESKRLQAMEPGKRAYDTTSEPAKMLGDMLGISPVKLDYLARSYFGGLFTTTASLVNPMLADSSNIKPDGTMSDLPVFGQMFQPEDAGGITQRAYEVLQKAAQTNATYKHLAETGDTKGAEEYLQKHGAGEIGMGASAESMKAQLDQLSGAIRTVKEQKLPPGMNPQQFAVQKREQLTQLQKARAEVAQEFTKSIAEIKRQSSR